ncbi:ribonuclease D [Varunaivibrio sulfuroxidans]|uniref:Ribonuclease D n=1 Tax=Varunaivibrio sulfuroxidans TaxID=1773489 RepID=A0A4R3J6A2_9PROT|nr:ribonuclease D [Varunaivibrio sulfuroxidans]TCS60366.1 ribonuclease D [Varunaivibrio sulfuroxidans]WES30946.1 ribonuclease D [Varunaivibrio sulfuroxidans]
MIIIKDTNDLSAFCARHGATPFITVDTEFMRETTYWPILCLIQVAAPDEAVIIDPLAPGMDLSPLFDLLLAPNIIKVFHAARQDMEIFYRLMGSLPHPIFDTQIAAMVCGFGDSVGYENLISRLTNARIDKSSRFTDWSLRPLSERQLSYALADVTHLREAYGKLKAQLENSGRGSWLDAEMNILTTPTTYEADPYTVFRRIKVRNPRPRFLGVLRELAAWRELEARKRDLTRNRVLRDDPLVEIAHHTPKNSEDLARTRGLTAKQAHGEFGKGILDAVQKGLALPDSALPRAHEKVDLPQGIKPTAELLKVLLKTKCEHSGVAQKLIASSADIDLIAGFGEKADVPALTGWRAEVFGDDALKLRRGEIALAIKDGEIQITEIGQ